MGVLRLNEAFAKPFVTDEALESIAETTLKSLTSFFRGEHSGCEVCAADRKRSI